MRETGTQAILRALAYAAEKHRDQRRKGEGSPPFINHAIEVAELLARVASVDDPHVLQAAILHDTLEDTDTEPAELHDQFGLEVTALVQEVTDDKRLEKEERRRLQVIGAPELSQAAKTIRLADKIANVRSIAQAPPAGWSLERRREYVVWSQQVVAGCRGVCPALELHYDEAVQEALDVLGSP